MLSAESGARRASIHPYPLETIQYFGKAVYPIGSLLMYLKKGLRLLVGFCGCPEYIQPYKDSSRPAALVNSSNVFIHVRGSAIPLRNSFGLPPLDVNLS
jgi:hypothetical protein